MSNTALVATRTGNVSFSAAGVLAYLAAVRVTGIATTQNVCALLRVGSLHRSSPLPADTLVAGIHSKVAYAGSSPGAWGGSVNLSREIRVEIALLASKNSSGLW